MIPSHGTRTIKQFHCLYSDHFNMVSRIDRRKMTEYHLAEQPLLIRNILKTFLKIFAISLVESISFDQTASKLTVVPTDCCHQFLPLTLQKLTFSQLCRRS